MTEIERYEIQPLARFDRTPISVRRPREFACFSYDEDHQYHPDGRSIRWYYPPKIGTNLCHGLQTFRDVGDSKDEHLDGLLRTLTDQEKRQSKTCHADIITWRGMMTKIMASPYDNNSFEMNAVKFQGQIFIEENHEYKAQTRAEQLQQNSRPGMPTQEMMSYWGYKFETISTLPNEWDSTSRDYIEAREQQPVSNNAQYCSIVSTSIGKTDLILAGEVDAIWDQKPADPADTINWVELKTSASIESDKDMIKYERKLLKFWIQSFLLGVPKIIVGFRSKSGILQHVEELETQKLPSTVKRTGKGLWNGNICLNFAEDFLIWLRERISTPGVWRIRRRDRSRTIELFRIEENGHGNILSAEFMEWRYKLQEQSEWQMKMFVKEFGECEQ